MSERTKPNLEGKVAGKLTKEQITAINKSAEIGLILQREHPEIVELYRNGSFIPKIAETLSVSKQYDVNRDVAKLAVRYALVGYELPFSVKPYHGLLAEEERIRLGKEHQAIGLKSISYEQRVKTSRKWSKINYSTTLGKLTKEQLRDAGKKGFSLGVGRLTKEQLRQQGRKMQIMMGHFPFIESGENGHQVSEIEFACELHQSANYAYTKGPQNGKPNLTAIANKLNEVYHSGRPVRSNISVNGAINTYLRKKKQEQGVE